MKRSGRSATIVAAALLCVSVATAAQEQSAAPQDQTIAAQEQVFETPQRVVAAEEPAAAPDEQIVETPQRVVSPQEPTAVPPPPSVEAPRRVVAAEEPAAGPPAEPAPAAAQEPAAAPAPEPVAEVVEEPVKAEEPPAEPEETPASEEPANVKFVDINDAVPTRFFDAAATAADPADPNRLIIALHTDSDWATFKGNNFRASTAAFSHLAAMDTLSFRIEAPKGQRIAKVTYTQRGNGSVIRVAKAAGATHWVVGDYAAQLGVFGPNPSVVGVADLSENPLGSVDVSITTGLFAFAAATSGSASIEVTNADVVVELVPATDGI
jgi:outer membrane biosynthesis protein TonB